MKEQQCGRAEHPKADGFITPTDEDEDNFDVELTDAPAPTGAAAPLNTNQKKEEKDQSLLTQRGRFCPP